MPVGLSSRHPVRDEALVLHMIENAAHEIAFVAHRRGELPADAFYRASEKTAVVKFVLGKTMVAEFVGLNFQYLRVLFDVVAKRLILFAGDNTHAAALARSAQLTRIGSNIFFARYRTTGTTTPSPVR